MFQIFAYSSGQSTLQRVISINIIEEFPKMSNWSQVKVEKEIKFWFKENNFFSFISETTRATVYFIRKRMQN